MIIYNSLIFLVLALSITTLNYYDKKKRSGIIILISSIGVVLIQGLRNIQVGIDLLGANQETLSGYIHSLEYAKDMNFFVGDKLFNYEIGYSLYSQFLSKLNVSNQLYLSIVSITIMTLVGYTWFKNSKMPGLSVFIYITYVFFTFTFSGLRQSIAIAILFFSFKFIQEKKITEFIICIALATSFHITSIIFVAAYPLYSFKLERKHFYFIVPTFIMTFLLRGKLFLLIYKLLKGYEGQLIITQSYNMLFILLMIYLSAHFFGKENKNELRFNAYKNYMLIAMYIYIFASVSSNITRAAYSYTLFLTLLIPEIIKSQKIFAIKVISTSLIIIILFYYFQKSTGSGYLDVSPYKFYWQN